MVTGSTDGIGKEYAKQLAQRGVNIVLIARNESKLIQVSREIGKFCYFIWILSSIIIKILNLSSFHHLKNLSAHEAIDLEINQFCHRK